MFAISQGERDQRPYLKHSQRFGGGGGGGFGGGLLGGAAGYALGGPNGAAAGGYFGSQDPGLGKGGKGGGGWKPTQARPDFSAFDALNPTVQAGIMGNASQMGGIAGSLGQLASGANWDQFTKGQLGQFDVLGNQRQQSTLGQLARQGVTGTGATNALNMQQYQTDAQRQALSGQLGQQGLQFRGQMLGAEEGALGGQNAMLNEALQNTLAKPAIQVGATAAGNVAPPGGKKGGSGGGKK